MDLPHACPHCQQPVPAAQSRCHGCGESPPAGAQCPTCGQVATGPATRCGRCGTDLPPPAAAVHPAERPAGELAALSAAIQAHPLDAKRSRWLALSIGGVLSAWAVLVVLQWLLFTPERALDRYFGALADGDATALGKVMTAGAAAGWDRKPDELFGDPGYRPPTEMTVDSVKRDGDKAEARVVLEIRSLPEYVVVRLARADRRSLLLFHRWQIVDAGSTEFALAAAASPGQSADGQPPAIPPTDVVPTDEPSTDPAPADDADQSGWRGVTGPYNLSTEIPAAWTPMPRSDSAFQAGDPLDGGRFVRYGAAPVAGGNVIQRREQEERENPNIQDGYQRLALQPTAHLDAPAVLWEFEFNKDGLRRHVRAMFWEVDGVEYFVYASTTATEWEDTAPIFEHMVDTAAP